MSSCNCLRYLDAIIIFLLIYVQNQKNFNLMVKDSKCDVFKCQVFILCLNKGFEIKQSLQRHDQYPNLQNILGLTGYQGEFIEGYSQPFSIVDIYRL